ncbi:CsbD family protein [Streptomyces bohaiensis]|uniref:CsbD family protein n=1 Tax=Streptomyces bohaiensis TaxID=1431344 RepID=A0ABX1CCS7_9ACTN|nr:CsbD family protein [Streptomyces bohaiensis]NJQ15520.1 CsbD family protein [Streptomyces bohaiensis]
MSAEGNGDRLKGKAKEAIGKVTGNDRMRAEGKADQAKGSAKNGVSAVTGGLAGIKDSLTSDRREPRS